jgi:hypothetical protein
MGNNSSVWPTVVTVLVVALLAFNTWAVFNVTSQDVVVPTADEIAAKVKVTSVTTDAYNDTALVAKVDKLSNEVLKDDLKEAKALELFNEELSSKDFKKELVSFLNAELNASGDSSTVEDYKDIESVVVTDGADDVVVSGDSATVTLTLKVKYLLDGDTDSEDVEAAKVKVELSVDDLDEDEEYVDAEVDSYGSSDFTLVKFYPR